MESMVISGSGNRAAADIHRVAYNKHLQAGVSRKIQRDGGYSRSYVLIRPGELQIRFEVEMVYVGLEEHDASHRRDGAYLDHPCASYRFRSASCMW